MIHTAGIDLNPEFLSAISLMNDGQSVFITGKAGTGKSTLLRYFLETTDKEYVVVAPTGVAALNVGGSTIHRLFSFPSWVDTSFVRSNDYYPNTELMRHLEVLIIDEVSMVRADLFDSMEAALRRFGPKRGEPFGGVQIVLVGDPYQLPPVVLEGEESFFRGRYPTPYFFSADSFRDFRFMLIELHRVYRQSDSEFIGILNAIRVGETTSSTYEILNEKFDPSFEPPPDEFWITLTTTNAMADTQNRRELEKIETELFTSKAEIFGEIVEREYPTAKNLEFKIGAQVMLLTNDQFDRWVNGSMGVIEYVSIDTDLQVSVRITETDELVELGRHTWEVMKPVTQGNRIRQELIGSFRQLPFRLSWAITIHKSQGKTLDNVIVSLGRGTFAEGQLYVALSRCTSLEGLKLKSEVKPHHVKLEREVSRWLRRKATQEANIESLSKPTFGKAFLGALVTGHSRYDKILELGFVVERESGGLEKYSTFINPMRDIGNSDDHGITAASISAAPTFGEAWPFFARRLAGLTLIANGLPHLQTSIERESANCGFQIDLGLGIDIQPFIEVSLRVDALKLGYELPLHPSALDIAFTTREIFDVIAESNFVTLPYFPGQEGVLPARIQTRPNEPSYLDLTSTVDAHLAYRDLAVLIASQEMDQDQSRSLLADQVRYLNLSEQDVAHLNSSLLEDLLTAIRRDGQTSESEQGSLQRLASVLGVGLPPVTQAASKIDLSDLLPPGSAVCFTGSATDGKGAVLERTYLESLAEEMHLKTVKSVTKKCVAVIAADTSSMSGKAKEARTRGVAVVHVHEFIDWASEINKCE